MLDVEPLVSLTDAKRHLRLQGLTSPDVDAEVQLKLDAATAIILDYLGARADATWTELTVPGPVHAAILLQLTELYVYRGDVLPPRGPNDHLAAGITALLMRLRDPAVA